MGSENRNAVNGTITVKTYDEVDHAYLLNNTSGNSSSIPGNISGVGSTKHELLSKCISMRLNIIGFFKLTVKSKDIIQYKH